MQYNQRCLRKRHHKSDDCAAVVELFWDRFLGNKRYSTNCWLLSGWQKITEFPSGFQESHAKVLEHFKVCIRGQIHWYDIIHFSFGLCYGLTYDLTFLLSLHYGTLDAAPTELLEYCQDPALEFECIYCSYPHLCSQWFPVSNITFPYHVSPIHKMYKWCHEAQWISVTFQNGSAFVPIGWLMECFWRTFWCPLKLMFYLRVRAFLSFWGFQMLPVSALRLRRFGIRHLYMSAWISWYTLWQRYFILCLFYIMFSSWLW